MNILTRIRLGLFGKNNPSKFQQTFKKHILDTTAFSYAKDTEGLCQKYGFNYKKFAKWAKYESERCEDTFEKRMLSQIFNMYCFQLAEKGFNSKISRN